MNLDEEIGIVLSAKRHIGWMVDNKDSFNEWRQFHIWEYFTEWMFNGFEDLMKWLEQDFVNDKDYRIHCVSWFEVPDSSTKHKLTIHKTFTVSKFKHEFGLRKGEFWVKK